MVVYLKKDKDNEYDKEAISVNLAGLGKIDYVANSPYTVLGESYNAGRLYDKIEDEAQGKIKFILDKGVVCELVGIGIGIGKMWYQGDNKVFNEPKIITDRFYKDFGYGFYCTNFEKQAKRWV